MELEAEPQLASPQAAGPAERLRAYLLRLSPAAQSLLIREFERVAAQGADAVATFVLRELRALVPAPELAAEPQAQSPARDLAALVFAPLVDFVADTRQVRPGAISLPLKQLAWTWIERDGMSAQVAELAAALDNAGDDGEAARSIIQTFRVAVADTFASTTAAPGSIDPQRSLFRLGGPELLETASSIGAVLRHSEQLEAFKVRLPTTIRAFGESQINSVIGLLKPHPALTAPQVLPFTLALIMQRLAARWQIVRLAIAVAGSDEEGRVAANPFGVSVQMVLDEFAALAALLHEDVRRGLFEESGRHLKTLHDGIRDLRSAVAIRPDSVWGKQLAALRIEISRSLKNDIESVPGRVRRLLRQRPDKDIGAASRLDQTEVDETAALIGMVIACKPYASELAISEMTLRAVSELQNHVETSTEGLVAALRASDGRTRPFRRQQAEVAIRFCEPIFGHDYAELMQRAADNALAAAAKPKKSG